MDPEIGVVGARATSGEWLGCLVNFACHPTDHGDDGVFTAGFPGILSSRLREEGVPACLFVNGALGNAHPMDPTRGGEALAERVVGRWQAWGSALTSR